MPSIRPQGDDRGWDGCMASLTRWTLVWGKSRSWWWTGRPGVLRFMGSQRVGHNWATELKCTELILPQLDQKASNNIKNIVSQQPEISKVYRYMPKQWVWWLRNAKEPIMFRGNSQDISKVVLVKVMPAWTKRVQMQSEKDLSVPTMLWRERRLRKKQSYTCDLHFMEK